MVALSTPWFLVTCELALQQLAQDREGQAAAPNIFASKIYSSGRAPPWRTHTRLIETTAELGHTLGQIANVDCEDERAGRS
jgi:hypothetical protein